MNSSQKIKNFFNEIAQSYDLINNLLSLGCHHYWNNHLLKLLEPTGTLLDLCAGTGQISIKFLKNNKNSQAILMDFSEKMLEVASCKGRKVLTRMSFIKGDVHNIPLKNCSIPFISISYGLRNLLYPEDFLKESYRILQKNGRLGILELTKPEKWKRTHLRYIKLFTTFLGTITKNCEAYHHLNDSIQTFPETNTVSENLLKVGFKILKRKTFFYGAVTIWIAVKP